MGSRGKRLLLCSLLLAQCATVFAQQVPQIPAALAGRVVVRSLGDRVVIALAEGPGGLVDYLFVIQTSGLPAPISFASSAAMVHSWRGHVVVIAPAEKKAFHFSHPEAPAASSAQAIQPFGDASSSGAGPFAGGAPSAPEADALLAQDYDLTRVASAQAIVARTGRLQGLRLDQVAVPEGAGLPALHLNPLETPLGDRLRALGMAADLEPNQQLPGTGGGNENCGATCGMSCRDGSSCTVSCVFGCARCTCPASCSCG